MDYAWFVKQRTSFIRNFHRDARLVFAETMRKIQDEEPPFDDPPYSEDPEPPYLPQWMEARDSILIVGETCVSMLSATLRVFIQHRLRHVRLTDKDKKVFRKLGVLRGYRDLLKRHGLSIDDAPVDYKVLEEVELVRNHAQHPRHLIGITSTFSDESLQKLPSPIFVAEDERTTLQGLDGSQKGFLSEPAIHVTPESLDIALLHVETFCQWFDAWAWDHHAALLQVNDCGFT